MALRFLIFLIGRGGVGARGGSGRGSARGGGIGRERSGLNGGVEGADLERSGLNGGVEGAGLERRGLNGGVAGAGGERRGEGFSMGYWGDGGHESKYWGDGGTSPGTGSTVGRGWTGVTGTRTGRIRPPAGAGSTGRPLPGTAGTMASRGIRGPICRRPVGGRPG